MKKVIVLLMVFVSLILYCGCFFISPNNVKINVRVYSVDSGLFQGKLVCENKGMCAYLDGHSIFLMKQDGSTEKMADVKGKVEYIALNSSYIFYATNERDIYSISLNNKEIKKVIRSLTAFNSIDDKVYVVDGTCAIMEIGDGIEKIVKFDIDDDEIVSKSKDLCLYDYDQTKVVIYKDQKRYAISNYGYYVNSEKISEFYQKNWDFSWPAINASHVAFVDGCIYVLYQVCVRNRANVNVDYKYKKGDALVIFDENSKKAKVSYITPDASEQICGFSVEKNEMYLLNTGKLYVSDLKGENRKEIENLKGHKTISFEYAMDKLWVYDEKGNLLFTY